MKKKENTEPGINCYTLPSGKVQYEYYFEIARKKGKRRFERKRGFKTQKEALAARKIALREYELTGRVFKPSKMSYADFLDLWLDSLSKVKDTTRDNYRKKINNYIKPHLGKYYLKSITAQSINDLFILLAKSGATTTGKGLTKNTLAGIKGIITKSFKYAVANNYIKDNPCSNGIDIPVVEEDFSEGKQFSAEHPHCFIEQDKLDEIFNRFDAESSVYIPLQFGLQCGLRLGEAFAVRWCDIDFDNKELTVNRQVQWHQDTTKKNRNDPKKRKPQFDQSEIEKSYWYFTLPKYKSTRKIELSDSMIEILRHAKDRQEQCKLIFPPYEGKAHTNHYHFYHVAENNKIILSEPGYTGKNIDFVCTRPNGEWVTPRVTLHASRVIHNELDFKEFTFHSLRHTHASLLAQHGAPPSYVQNRLGHKNLDVTLNTYYHYTDFMKDQGLNKLNEIFRK